MSGFGDYEPEDAYDASDPPHVRLANIVTRLRLLIGINVLQMRDHQRLAEAIEDLERVVEDVRDG